MHNLHYYHDQPISQPLGYISILTVSHLCSGTSYYFSVAANNEKLGPGPELHMGVATNGKQIKKKSKWMYPKWIISVFSSTGQRPDELMRWPVIRCPSSVSLLAILLFTL